jgi:hypothetical protein
MRNFITGLGVYTASPFAFLIRHRRSSSNAAMRGREANETERFPARHVRSLPEEGVAL